MKHILTLLAALLLAPLAGLHAAEIILTAPLDYQVIQRMSRTVGEVRIRGTFADAGVAKAIFETRMFTEKSDGPWQKLAVRVSGESFEGTSKEVAGGWYRLQVRALQDGKIVGDATVEHVGIGEVFVVAGQSNSANHGETKQNTQTKRVAAFDGHRWRLADDPQPGASGMGGSFMPPFGDAVVQRFNVPVGFIACGIGATSVREWLPKGATFPYPPTIESRVTQLPDGSWESNGEAFANFVARMKQAGPHGFRAVLWHQGESDANQKDAARTLPGNLYREYLERVIRESRREIGWDAPWFVAQVSYHVPGDEASPDIRKAQASLWRDGPALEGPDSDALKGALREANGQGVHFSDVGLQEHAAKWAEKVCPWIESQEKTSQ
ncbi:MAG: sialate O-acetylesterase [Chthoniobacter sp.]|uniref:sialate O-acetylesterase n=1 Tax=Chthoniobacter sp. TaxID=2510640 RepID=UPI0032A69CE2